MTFLTLHLLVACGGLDADGDGALDSVDCDDQDPTVWPGAPEFCNEVDDDCDGQVDEDATGDGKAQYLDSDGDGYGLEEVVVHACGTVEGYAAEAGDCDDAEPEVHPGADEICGDGVDNDCQVDVAVCRPPSGSLADRAQGIWAGADDAGLGGRSVDGAGDLDGDGLDDLVFGAPYGANRAGQVVLALGPGADLGAVATLTGAWPGDYLGWAVSGPGDLDGDGFADLALGAWGRDELATTGGTVYLVRGPYQGAATIDTVAAAAVHGVEEDARLAWSVDGGSDLNGDGQPDLVLGAWREPAADLSRPGAVWVLADPLAASGAISDVGSRLIGESDEDAAGYAVADLGDVDGDGVGDLAIGAPGQDSAGAEAGVVYLVRGPVTGDSDLADAAGRWAGTDVLQGAGAAVASGGDQDGDGLGDLLVGSHAGHAWLVIGTSTGQGSLADADVHFTSDTPSDRFGQAVAGPGDVDGDGHDDLWIGVPNHDEGRGAASLIYGPVAGGVDVTETTWTGSVAGGHAGTSVAGAGDVNRDGLKDLILGGPDVFTEDEIPGTAWLLLGVGE